MTPLVASYSAETRQHLRGKTPLGYLMRPQDIQGAVVYLASAASDYMTGQELVLDGGYATMNHSDKEYYERAVPPRVSAEDEVIEMNSDLAAVGDPKQR